MHTIANYFLRFFRVSGHNIVQVQASNGCSIATKKDQPQYCGGNSAVKKSHLDKIVNFWQET
jgi:hypothetical protein